MLAGEAPSPWNNFWYGPLAVPTRAGVDVNVDVALTLSGCFAATKLIASTMACLPLKLMRREKDGGTECLDDEPLYSIVHDAPNTDMTSATWRAAKFGQLVNLGNCISEIERDGNDEIKYLWPIHISRVTMRRRPAIRPAQFYYDVVNDDGTHTELEPVEVMHVPTLMTDDGRWGKGTITYAREGFGHALATERYGAGFFGSGGRPTGILKHPKKMDKEARSNLRREWNESYGGGPDNPNKTAVLWEGMEYQQITSTPEDSQFLQSRQHNLSEIARWYGVPVHLLQGEMAPGSIEEQGLNFYRYCMLPWCTVFESEANRKLLTAEQRADGWFFMFVVDGLERANMSTRTANLCQQFFNGALTLNQWMRIENRPPIGPLGDIHFLQQAMVPLEIAAKGPQPIEQPADPNAKKRDDGEYPEPKKLPAPRNLPGNGMVDEDNKDYSATENAARTGKLHAAALKTAFQSLDECVGNLLAREARDVQQAAKQPDKFLAWVDSYYEEHGSRMRRALATPIKLCVQLSADVDPSRQEYVDDVLERAVRAHVDRSRDLLLNAALVTSPAFSDEIALCVRQWKRNEILSVFEYQSL